MADWSFVDADFFIRAGSGLLFFVVGAFMLMARPRKRGNVALALATLTFGLAIAVNNFEFGFQVQDGYRWSNVAIGSPLYILTGAALAAAALQWPQRAGAPDRLLVAASIALVAALAVSAWALATSQAISGPGRFASLAFRTMYCGGALLTVACASRLRTSPSPKAWPLAIVACAIPAMGYVNLGGQLQSLGGLLPTLDGVRFVRNLLYFVGFAVPFALGAAALAWAVPGRAPRPAATALLYLLGLATLAVVVAALTGEAPGPGARGAFAAALPGLVRIAGAAALAFAVFRLDLLGVPLPALRGHVGAVAVLFLVVLFALAQVLENVVGGAAGLGIGAGVALVSVFVGPRIEGLVHGLGRRDADEEAYRDAVRAAGRDKRFTPEEERALMVLASRLGISAERAYAIRDEVEQAAASQATGSTGSKGGRQARTRQPKQVSSRRDDSDARYQYR